MNIHIHRISALNFLSLMIVLVSLSLMAVVLVALTPLVPTANALTKTTLAKVPAAENQMYTSTNRLFVSGDKGIYELIPGANNTAKVIERAPKQSCAFGGLVEAFGYLYANCSGGGSSHIYAAKLSATPSFKRIYTLKGVLLANGLTADNAGRLYVAATFNGQILRLTPSTTEPLTIKSREVWARGLLPNGVKFAAVNSSIYWTDTIVVKRAELKTDGKPGKIKILFGALAYFDDLAVDSNGILVTDFIRGSIRTYNTNARPTGIINARLSGPSSIQRAKAPYPSGSLIATERLGNRVTLLMP